MLKPISLLLSLCLTTTAWAAEPTPPAAVKPALTVSTVQASAQSWGVNLLASGNIAPWQEASIGAELGGLRLTEVRVNVGDAVRKGQVLAVFDSESIASELAQQRAVIVEAEAVLAEARANAKRSQSLSESGFISSAQLLQTQTAEKSAQARLLVATTALSSAQLRLKHTQVLATDSGVISQRLATVGAVSSPGQELFRLIRQGRLEWRAEVPSAELGKLKPGAVATIVLPNQNKVSGKLRVIAPTVDMQTRNALVYVDLAAGSEARSGML
jgi:HlyD family secretion protein